MGRMFILAAAILSAAFLVSTGQAASFDCGKASTSFEKAICADDDLSSLDEDVAEAFAQLREKLDEEGREATLQSQREWLTFARRACSPQAEPVEGTYSEQATFCLQNVLGQRVRDLTYEPSMGGLSFYMVQRYRAVPASEVDDWWQASQKSLSYPVFVGAGEHIPALNDFVTRTLGTLVYDMDPEAPTYGYSDDDTSLSVATATSQLLSIQRVDYSYGHGAAHGNYGVGHVHFLPGEGRPLREIDIFSRPDWPSAILTNIQDALESDLGEGSIWPGTVEAMQNDLPDTERWVISSEGLGFQFQPYEVAPYAAGAPVALVPWSAMGGYLSDDALKIAGAE